MFPMVCDVYVDQRLIMEIKYTEVQFLRAFNESVFAKPRPPASQVVIDKLKSAGFHIKINGVER